MIVVDDLHKTYGDFQAVRGISFEVSRGEVVGFLGPNGAGKTTTMRVLCGCIGATSGRATIDGHDVLSSPRRAKRRVGYLPEVPPLYTSMPVRDYVMFAAEVRRVGDSGRAADQALDRVGLTPVAHRLIDHLSKGFRQRVGLAQALVHDPDVLVLDEPTSGLDPAQRVEIRGLLKELAAGDRTVILSTHVLPEVEAVCGRVIIINQGRVVAQDSLDVLSESHRRLRVLVQDPNQKLQDQLGGITGVREVSPVDGGYLVVAGEDVRPDVARASVSAGLLELRPEGGLEDMYLQVTRGAVA